MHANEFGCPPRSRYIFQPLIAQILFHIVDKSTNYITFSKSAVLFFSIMPLLCSFYLIQTATADSVIAEVKVGVDPVGIVYHSVNKDMYVANQGPPVGPGSSIGSVSVIDGSTNEIIDNPIRVGSYPTALAYNSNNNNIYVANSASDSADGNSVSVIDGTTNMVVDTIPVGMGPVGIAYDSINGNLYVTNINSDSVSVIDGSTNEVVGTIPIGSRPYGIAVHGSNGYIYVCNYEDNSVSVIDGSTNEVVGTAIPVGVAPVGIAYNPFNNNVYVTNDQSNSVSVIDGSTNEVVGTIPVGVAPQGIAFNSANNKMYVTSGTGSISVIDSLTNNVVETVSVSYGLVRIAYNAENNNMYAVNAVTQTVYVVATTAVTPTVGTSITSAVDGNNLLVANNTGSTVSDKITFTFESVTDNSARFECALDSSQFSACSSPKQYNNLGMGKHAFKVRAIDESNNVDLTPALFRWNILTPEQATQNLINTIDSMHLSRGTTMSLEAPLYAAYKTRES